MTPDRAPRRRRTLALLVVLGVPALLVGADLVRDRGISRFHDNQAVQGPLRVEAARQWSSGRIPLWNPYKRAGAPLLADVAGALYPPNLLFIGSDATQRDRALDRVGALHHLLAAAAAYFLLCTLGLRQPAVVLGALVYSLNGFIVFGAGRWVDLQNSMVWAPLILASVVRAEASRDRFWAWSGLGALAFALQISCGYPEYAFYTALLVAALGACLVLRAPGRWRRGSAAVSVIGIGGAALAAPQLLTTLEAVLRGTRAARVSYAEFVSHSLRPTDLIGLVLPVGPSDQWPDVSLYLANGALFVGVGAVAFGAAALVRPRAISLYALGLVGVGALLALGENSPFGAIGYHVPGLNAFRSPMKHLFELTLGISMLGAIGVDRFLQALPRTRYAVAGTAIACASLAAYGSARTGLEYGAAGAIGCLAFAGLALWPDRRAGVYAALVTTPLLLGLNRHAALEHLRAEPRIPEVRAELAAQLRLGPTDRVLVIRDRVLRNPLVADRAVAWQIPAAHGAGPFLWAPLAAALEMDEIGNLRAARILRPDDATLDLLSVRTLLSPRSRRGPAPRERLLRELYPGRISEVPEFLVVDRGSAWPFARVVDRVECLAPAMRGVSGEVESVETESAARAARVATLSCFDAAGGEPPSSGGRAELAHFAPGEVAVRARVLGPEPGLLVLSQPDYPGWVAAIDGRRAPIRRVSGLVQGIWLPPGEHRVELEYCPGSFRAGVGLALLAATGLGFMALRERRLKKPT